MLMKRFLAATDGSADGEHAVFVGEGLAQRAGGEFARLAVADSSPAWEPGLERWRDPVSPGGTATRIRGLAGIEIVHHAERWGADMVVLGRHERKGLGPVTVGATSDNVLRRRNGVSLFVPPQTRAVKRALIAIDGSYRGLGILGPAEAFLKLTGARAFAVTVLPGVEPEVTELMGWQHPSSERVRAMVDRLQLPSGPCDFLVRWGEAVHHILDLLDSTRADLLILGVRRGGALGDFGSGHVGRDLLKAAPTAVLTIPI